MSTSTRPAAPAAIAAAAGRAGTRHAGTPATTATAPTTVIRPARPVARVRGSLRVLDVREDLSRVTRSNGEIVGYVERVDVAGGRAFRARRYLPAERRFVDLPTVWNAEDAIDCLRW